ncbi:MAG: RNA polymerase sigma factor [Aristaeellaceae bacterium]
MDEVTLRRAQKGDAAAFEQLITPYEGLVWRVCWRYTHNREDANDCAQEAMVKAWRSLPQYRQECALETWLYRVSVSCCLDFLRRRRGQENVSLAAMTEAGFDPPADTPSPEESLLHQEETGEVAQAIRQLPEDMRTVLILSALEDCRYEEIAQITGTPVGTVKSRLNRARVKLADILVRMREPSGKNRVQQHERRTKP